MKITIIGSLSPHQLKQIGKFIFENDFALKIPRYFYDVKITKISNEKLVVETGKG